MKHFLFTILFGLLCVTLTANGGKTLYFVGVWDGNSIQINNPQRTDKNKFCINKIQINGVKIKTDYKTGGIEIDASALGFKAGDQMLIEIKTEGDCDPSFHSAGFHIQP